MKCSVFVAAIACVLSVTLADSQHKVDQAHSDFMSHVDEQMGGIHMMRANSTHMECYNSFVQLIDAMANKAKSDSQACVDKATSDKEFRKNGLQEKRTALENDIKKIKKSFEDCSSKSGLEFFKCLSDANAENTRLLEEIKTWSESVSNDDAVSMENIVTTEKTCLRAAVDAAKQESDSEFTKLRVCLQLDPKESEQEHTS